MHESSLRGWTEYPQGLPERWYRSDGTLNRDAYDSELCHTHNYSRLPPAKVEEEICRYKSQADRLSEWTAIHGPVPNGLRLGHTCAVAYCGKLEHMVLVENKNAAHCSYTEIHELLQNLKVGEGCYLLFPNDETARRNLRAAMHMKAGKLRFTLRAVTGSMMYLQRIEDWPA